jgi:hypothetical protein
MELRDLKHLLETDAYLPEEIERVLDPDNPCFVSFDPELGYVLKDYDFNDGMDGIKSDYTYYEHGGHRLMVNYADKPCRINTYGNSYTQAAQVSNGESWQEVLAANFHEPIRNFGVGGYGVYQAYRRAMRTETDADLATEYIVLNIWDDDYLRNIDAARWVRVGWMLRDVPRGGSDGYPVHGFPWAHIRYDLDKGGFVEHESMADVAEDLRKLVGKENFYNAFKDDHAAHLYCLREGGDAPVDELEKIAEALGMKADLRTPETRTAEALKLHHAYGQQSTMYLVDKFQAWANENDRKLMVMLSYDVPTVQTYINTGERFDEAFVDYIAKSGTTYVDTLPMMGKEYEDYSCDVDTFLDKFHVGRAGAQVFGHYNPYGNFWFAFAVRQAMVNWLSPKPPSCC